jgi:helix-turn-helix protein
LVVEAEPLTVNQAAARAKVHPKTVYHAIERGELPHFRKHQQQGIGVWPKDLDRWISGRRGMSKTTQ